jgi:hypothetical protein
MVPYVVRSGVPNVFGMYRDRLLGVKWVRTSTFVLRPLGLTRIPRMFTNYNNQ